MTQRPDVVVLGLRGFPDVQGGVETHAEHLFPKIAAAGVRVVAVTRSPYLGDAPPAEWRGVRFVNLWAPKSRSLEAIVHTFLGVLYAAWARPRILHIQAIGPALMAPLARLCGLRVVVTHHGPDYDRQKWGRAAKLVLRLGEAMGMRCANRRIVISRTIQDLVRRKYGLDSALIPNGVVVADPPEGREALDAFGLETGKYVLLVGRLVAEKRHLDLIDAFARCGLDGWKLVLVGGADHPDAYSREVERRTAETPNVVATGFQKGVALRQLFANAGVFVLPSSHEGLPIALLEALSYGLPSIASDIPANLEVGLPAEAYFPLGDVAALADRLADVRRKPADAAQRQAVRAWVARKYDWAEIAKATIATYRAAAGGKGFSAAPETPAAPAAAAAAAPEFPRHVACIASETAQCDNDHTPA